MEPVKEGLIKLTEYEVLGNLPDVFLLDNGKRVSSVSEWEERRKEIFKTAVELQYGTMPPKPEFFRSESCSSETNDKYRSYRITAGTNEKQVMITLKVFFPKGEGPFPLVIDGDLCFNYAFDKEFISAFTDNGIAYAVFDRTILANDKQNEGRRKGPLYDIYPEYTFGAIGAWAWGYSRCLDALINEDFTDKTCIAFTGHSRGAKTAMLAGVLDERCTIVNPNETCAGSCGCYRIHMRGIKEDGDTLRSERLADLWKNYGFWIGEGMGEYAEKEDELPFDAHFLKALVAPRVLLVGEAASDMWANPVGSWQTTMAAGEVYKYSGKEENLYWYYRKGYHKHAVTDIEMLVSVIRHHRYGEPLCDGFFVTPFEKPELIYDWSAPEK